MNKPFYGSNMQLSNIAHAQKCCIIITCINIHIYILRKRLSSLYLISKHLVFLHNTWSEQLSFSKTSFIQSTQSRENLGAGACRLAPLQKYGGDERITCFKPVWTGFWRMRPLMKIASYSRHAPKNLSACNLVHDCSLLYSF